MNENWYPIVTVPKDRMIVLGWAGSHTTRAFWYNNGWCEAGSGDVLDGPTHWTELPLPPAKIDKL